MNNKHSASAFNQVAVLCSNIMKDHDTGHFDKKHQRAKSWQTMRKRLNRRTAAFCLTAAKARERGRKSSWHKPLIDWRTLSRPALCATTDHVNALGSVYMVGWNVTHHLSMLSDIKLSSACAVKCSHKSWRTVTWYLIAQNRVMFVCLLTSQEPLQASLWVYSHWINTVKWILQAGVLFAV